MKNESDQSAMSLGRQIAIASELGGALVICVVAGYFLGNWVDGMAKSGPYGVVVGLMVGMGVGLGIVVKRSNQLDKETPMGEPSSSQEPADDEAGA